jgi:UDP-N-acetylmuramoylalanine--D-glutamate ligase
MLQKLHDFFKNKKILLLGFGLEGQSTMRLLEKLNCAKSVEVWEKHHHSTPIPPEYDIVMKSPGIPLFENMENLSPKITGQADLFLRFCSNPVVGITGTKGKSTTSSLLHHILCECGKKSRLIGNIGVPPLDIVQDLSEAENKDNLIVFELSCHQLEYCKASPKIAVFINLFEEHLDHYIDFPHYRHAKENIFRFQNPESGDVLIRGRDVTATSLSSNKARLRGIHNLHNMAIAIKAAQHLGVDEASATNAAYSFGGLEHRLEFFTEIDGVKYVNDSISTIPAAAIAAVDAFPETDTLIIGGMDRGIDYSILIEFLTRRSDINVIALPDTGHVIVESISNSNSTCVKVKNMEEAVEYAKKITKQCCVLSPAAASYGVYKNFEERGKHFRQLTMNN